MADWCLTCQFEDYDGSEEPCINCVSDTEVEGNAKPTEYFPKKPPKPITNADRIRAMTDERLAVEMYAKGGCPHDCETPDDMDTDCVQCWLDWLREEAKE